MDDNPSQEYSTDDQRPLAVNTISRTPVGIRAETSGGVYTFRRDVDAHERGEDVWVPDVDTPPEVIGAVEYEGYDVATEAGENE